MRHYYTNDYSTRIIGTVVRRRSSKTGMVEVPHVWWNSKYKVKVRSTAKIFFHDEDEKTRVGDVVQIIHYGKKISKKKSFILDQIIDQNPLLTSLKDENVDAELGLQQIEKYEGEILNKTMNVRRIKIIPQHQDELKRMKEERIEREKAKKKSKKKKEDLVTLLSRPSTKQ